MKTSYTLEIDTPAKQANANADFSQLPPPSAGPYFDGVYSSPLDRAIALARGLGSVAAALWQRGHVGIVAMCLLRRCACVSVLICLIRINVRWRPHACGSKTTLSRLDKRGLNVLMT